MDSSFMTAMASTIAGPQIRVVRFDFPYMTKARELGKRRPPDSQARLLDAYRTVIEDESTSGTRMFIGGKSLGGRMASLIADEMEVAGLVCLGYPFHPPGKPDKLRTEHLKSLKTPALICQGSRDPFGRREEVEQYDLSDAIAVRWLEDGDHGFKPRKSSGRSEAGNLAEAAASVVEFIR